MVRALGLTDEEVEVADALVLAHQRGREAQLAVAVDDADHLRSTGTSACAQEEGDVRRWLVGRTERGGTQRAPVP